MTEIKLEGSAALEALAAIGKVEEFFEAIDSDDTKEVTKLLRQAQVDEDTIQQILTEISDES